MIDKTREDGGEDVLRQAVRASWITTGQQGP